MRTAPPTLGALLLVCALGAVLAVLSAPASAAPSGDPAEWMFTPSEVVRIDLTLSDEAVADLASAPREYVPAGFEMHGSDGRAFGPWTIQLKLKGNASFRPLTGKAAFKLKFPSGSRPSGLRKLTLNNMVQDPSKLRETLAYEVFRGLGVPAPRSGYAQVSVNASDYGLYLNLETLDSVSLKNWFASTGHLYESEWPGDAPYSTLEPGGETRFEVDEGSEDDRSDLAALIDALHAGTGGDLAAALGDHADVPEIARELGGEAFLGHWDGYGWGVNNFYLHADASGRFSLLPWGADQALQSWVPASGPWAPKGVLLIRCLADGDCAAARDAAIEQARALAVAGGLRARAAELYARLRPLIEADPRREHGLADSDAAAADVDAFLAARTAPPSVPPAPATDGGVPEAQQGGTPASSPPVAGVLTPRLTAARARVAVRRELRRRFGARMLRARFVPITCAPLDASTRRCRARWSWRGVRHERRLLVRLDSAGGLSARIT